ncbi:MAG: sensor histidine kinase [Anaerolineales bacterium]
MSKLWKVIKQPFSDEERGLNFAFAMTVLAVLIPTLVTAYDDLGLLSLLATTGLTLVFLILGLWIFPLIGHHPSNWVRFAYYLLQLGITLILFFITELNSVILFLPLPLVSQSVFSLPRLMRFALWVLIDLAVFVPVGLIIDWAQAIVSSIAYISAIVFVAAFSQVYVSEQRSRLEIQRLASALEGANQRLRKLAVSADELATTKERNRLAREIHDSLGHYLTVVNVQLEAARSVFDSDPQAALNALSKAQALTREGLQEVRRSVAALRASPLEGRPLSEAITDLLAQCQEAGLVADLELAGQPFSLPSQVEHTLYRAAQECLSNVRRHARASRLDVRLEYQPTMVTLRVGDNGVGFNLMQEQEGYGLAGLRERLLLLDGKLLIQSERSEGTKVEVSIPLTQGES